MNTKKLLIGLFVVALATAISLFLAHTGILLLVELGFHLSGAEFNWPSLDILIKRVKFYIFVGFIVSIFQVFVMWWENRKK